METLNGRIVRIETNEKIPVYLPSKDQHSLKQDYDLLEFAINTAEEFKKTMKKMRIAYTKYYRRVLVTYKRCQVAAEQRLDALPKHE